MKSIIAVVAVFGLAAVSAAAPAQKMAKKDFTTTLQGFRTVTVLYDSEHSFSTANKIIIGTTAKVDGKIVVIGKTEFEMTGMGIDGYEGLRRVVVNGVVKDDQNLMIKTIDNMPELLTNPTGTAKQLGFDNWKEVKCSKGDMLIMLSDNKTMTLLGNCMTPAGK